MGRGFFLFLILALAWAGPEAALARGKKKTKEPAEAPRTAVVTHVSDGDTFVLEDGERVRLLDINTPEIAHDGEPAEFYGVEAKQALEKMVGGKTVKLVFGPKLRDPYGRLLAHVYLADGTWVNQALVKEGDAHVYSFADNRVKAAELLGVEDAARVAGKGLWRAARWKVRDAAVCCAEEDMGTFMVVEGVPLQVLHVDDRTYMNFSKDWKRDFTVVIMDRDMRYFRGSGIDDVRAAYLGKRLRIRGHAQPVNGTLVRATHPEQLEVLR